MAPQQPSAATVTPGRSIPVPPLPPRPVRATRWVWRLSLLLLAVVLGYCWIEVGGSVGDLIKGLFGPEGLFRNVIPSAVPPDTSVFWDGVKAAMVTLSIAILSIVFGLVFSVAVLPFAARNLRPNRLVYEVVRVFLAILRAIPELIMLLIFQVVMGFSPYSAVVALTLHGTGVKGKLFAEAVEEMEMAPVDALRVAGASRTQVFLHGVLPGVQSTLLGLTLYRFDANFRSAVTLGAVGAGGIGFLIDNDLNVFQYPAVTTYLIIVVVFVLVIERFSSFLRARL
jgi:phosphonate transport system permease protein